MIAVRELRKSYGSRLAVDGLSLSIPQGVCYGLLGPNGAGKTTTISMVAGAMAPDSGSVEIDGQRIAPSELRAKRRLGYVPQELALYEDMSAKDNLRFFGLVYDISGADLDRAVTRCLEFAGLGDRDREPVRRFSGGMKRRLNIAIALLHDPAFLIFDEPTVGVDPHSRLQIFEALERLITAGKTVLYTTHYIEEVERLCQSVAIMDHGRIIADDTIAALTDDLQIDARVSVELRSVPLGPLVVFPAKWNATLVGRRVTVTLRELDSELPLALEAVRPLGSILRIDTERPSLEEVFLNLTGRRLRD